MARWSEMSWWSAKNFDERQLRVRGDVFLHGLVEALVLMAVLLAVPRGWAPLGYLSMLAVMAVVMAVAAELIWRGAYFPMGPRGEQMHGYVWLTGWLFALMLVVMVVFGVTKGPGLVAGGALTYQGALVLLYLMLCTVPLMHWLADRRDTRQERVEALADEAA